MKEGKENATEKTCAICHTNDPIMHWIIVKIRRQSEIETQRLCWYCSSHYDSDPNLLYKNREDMNQY